MLQESVEPAWADAFEPVPVRCTLRPGETAALPGEGERRPVPPQPARLGCKSEDTVEPDRLAMVEQGRVAA